MTIKIISFSHGYTLSELMIALALASLMSVGVLNFFIGESTRIKTETDRDFSAQEVYTSFSVIDRLLRQAKLGSLQITYQSPLGNGQLNPVNNSSVEIDNDALQIDFLVPNHYAIWPNDVPPYINNAIRIVWHNNSTMEGAYSIRIARAESLAALDSALLLTLAGGENDEFTRITNLDIWPLNVDLETHASANAQADSGYLVQMNGRTARPDMAYLDPNLNADDEMVHYRSYGFSNIVVPRN
ncbi:MAG: prepilin-type N-terminal cleavage/methylation domain-containing protein [Gammaproteobacteria bacterium]|nr:prepilin-type N-terminal cleavage/methylation domain-containing protein [Gammaproteobacteria bacterium]MDH5731253.1 prepilin-type N-terminal cleavage/methylation domain-containing protein [Gammaproteobacteria bacterium]